MRCSIDSPYRIRKLEGIAKRSPLITELRARVHDRNENALILVRGLPGSGKSMFCMAAAELLSPRRFSMVFVAYNIDDFLKILSRPDLQKGDVIVWDEPGEGVSSDEWQSAVNKCVKQIFRLFRYKNLIVFMCAPNESWVDKKIRGMFHGEVKCHSSWKKRDSNGLYSYAKFFWLDWSDRFQKIIRKRHILSDGTHLSWLKFRLPTEPILKAYLTKMNETKSGEISVLIEKQNAPPTEKKKATKINYEDLIKLIEKDPKKFQNTRGFISAPLISAHLGLSNTKAMALKHMAEKIIPPPPF